MRPGRSLDDPGARAKAVSETIRVWAQHDLAGLQTHAATLPPGDERNTAFASILYHLEEDDPPAAIRLLREIPEGPLREKAIGQMELGWTFSALNVSDPTAVTALLDAVPPGQGEKKLRAAIVGEWAQGDPTRAAQWLERLPAGPGRDDAVTAFAEKIFLREPASAIAWTKTIADPPSRGGLVQSFLARWKRNDLPVAEQWIRATDLLSPAEKQNALLAKP